LLKIQHPAPVIIRRAGDAAAPRWSMNNVHAPGRCDTRAISIAKVKFVALPLEMDLVPAEAGTPFRSGNRTNRAAGLFTTLHAFLIRVIGRL
jgi:hypothetical protein